MDEPPGEKISRKEYARQMRRAAYVRGKEQRANDPRYQALKALVKQRHREAYQAAKQRRALEKPRG